MRQNLTTVGHLLESDSSSIDYWHLSLSRPSFSSVALVQERAAAGSEELQSSVVQGHRE